MGRWQILELRAFISRCVDRELPVIPVLLPGTVELPGQLVFLKELSWVRLETLDDAESLGRLEWGITGVKPADLQE